MARSLSVALSTHLAGRAFVAVDLYDLVLKSGSTYRYTTHSANLTGVAPAAVATYTAGVLEAQGQRQAAGLIADDLEVLVHHGGTATIGGVAWVTAALSGSLDGATFTRWEGFLDPATGLVVGCVEAFKGDVSEVEPSSMQLRMVVSVPSKRFVEKFPVPTCQAMCVWDFASKNCGYGWTGDTFTGQVEYTATLATGSTASQLRISSVPASMPGTAQNCVQFDQGSAKVNGVWRYIASVENAGAPPYKFNVSPPFPAGVVEGLIGSAGALTLRMGCSKTSGVCDSAGLGYSRLASFLGAPQAPTSRDA